MNCFLAWDESQFAYHPRASSDGGVEVRSDMGETSTVLYDSQPIHRLEIDN